MTERELRVLVREAIARYGNAAPAGPAAEVRQGGSPPAGHASHARFHLPAGADGDGRCIIEPAVVCNHCGYCKSYGH